MRSVFAVVMLVTAVSTAGAQSLAPRPEDVGTIDGIIKAFYDVISGPAGTPRQVMIGIGIKVLFFRKGQLPKMLDNDQLDGLDERLLRTEAKVQELEERLDFAERMRTDVRGKAQLPQADRPPGPR